eukprot:3567270-Pyramimonas_sp.AAC.2
MPIRVGRRPDAWSECPRGKPCYTPDVGARWTVGSNPMGGIRLRNVDPKRPSVSTDSEYPSTDQPVEVTLSSSPNCRPRVETLCDSSASTSAPVTTAWMLTPTKRQASVA